MSDKAEAKPQEKQESPADKTKLPAEHAPEPESLPEQKHEDVLVAVRSKLFRFVDGEWKERGIGDVQLLKHKETKKVRVLMRREKTLKVCANHYVEPFMVLKKNVGSEKAFVWNSPADMADGESKEETFAIRFNNVENATKFKTAFDQAVEDMKALKDTDDKKEEEEETAPASEKKKDEEKKEGEKTEA